MPTWGQITYELQRRLLQAQRDRDANPAAFDPTQPSPHDEIRQKYLRELASFTKRPTIVYASAWLEGRQLPDATAVQVSTRDIMGFMEAIHGIEPGPLDLILHSPGGDANAAEQIMKYLRDLGFGPIRAIVPICAMSAATMMALCCDEILVGRHSQLGPIDPQFTLITPEGPRAAPAQAILDQFEQAKTECAANPSSVAAWLPILRSYLPGLLSQCLTAQTAAEDMVAKAMRQYMFSDVEPGVAEELAKEIGAWFNDHKTHRSHGRPLRYDDVQAQKVRISLLEDNDELQDKVLSAWHAIQLTLGQIAILKIIENSGGKAWMISGSPAIQIALGPPPGQPPAAPPGPPVSLPGPQPPPTRGDRGRSKRRR
jgi:Serine dehydrogenase proteinase